MIRHNFLLVHLLIAFSLVGCTNNLHASAFVESGFLYDSDNCDPTPWISTAIKADKTQEKSVTLIVSVGYLNGFIEMWDNCPLNPGYGIFILQRIITNKNETIISTKNFLLQDFNDESKYSIYYKKFSNKNDNLYFLEFNFKLFDSFSLDEISTNQGRIFYTICLTDSNKTISGDFFTGIGIGSLYFKKIDNQMMFSLYKSVFI